MSDLSGHRILFVVWAFFFQAVLIVHYLVRKWAFESYTLRYGWIVYALGVPAAVVSLILLLAGETWALWIGGLIHLVWSAYGYWVDYAKGIQWRGPIRWPVFGPYLFLYLATIMFYWWPLRPISKSLWYVYTLLYIISTVLNITSHR